MNSHWTIKGPAEKAYRMRGEPVDCGQKIRLEHLTTHRNLYSHLFSSHLANAQEVSAFGESGVGDTGYIWSVVCKGDFWNRDGKVRFKHKDTRAYLAASGHAFGRPISGQVGNIKRNFKNSFSFKVHSSSNIFVSVLFLIK